MLTSESLCDFHEVRLEHDLNVKSLTTADIFLCVCLAPKWNMFILISNSYRIASAPMGKIPHSEKIVHFEICGYTAIGDKQDNIDLLPHFLTPSFSSSALRSLKNSWKMKGKAVFETHLSNAALW